MIQTSNYTPELSGLTISTTEVRNWAILDCPVCGSGATGSDFLSSTHIDSVEVSNAANDNVKVSAQGEDANSRIDIVTSSSPKGGMTRRHVIRLFGTCEEGCEFVLEFMQHKGQTIVSVRGSETST